MDNLTIYRRLAAVDDKLEYLIRLTLKEMTMSDSVSQEITNLTTAVQQETTVNASAITLINGFAAQLAAAVAAAQAAGATPDQLTALNALATSVNSNATSLAAAVSAGTPAPQPQAQTSVSGGATA